MRIESLLALLTLAVAGFACGAAQAADKRPATLANQQGTALSEKGADTCLGCHDEESSDEKYQVKPIFQSKHGQRGHARSPFAKGALQCEACHGPGGRHSVKDSNKLTTINSFKADSFLSVGERNQACLSCHQDQTRNAWHGGAHDRSQVACSDCHKMHTEAGDKVLAKATQAEVCYSCHRKERADFQKPSSHPVRQGKMACGDCHNAHGSPATAQLTKPTLNQTCYSCHADKRGPMLWEHAPVAEDCSLCHTSHGSVRSALLNKPAPLLCQQCHSSQGHPSVPRTPAGLPATAGGAGTGAIFITAGSCNNCHAQVHGSNHPAGRKLLR